MLRPRVPALVLSIGLGCARIAAAQDGMGWGGSLQAPPIQFMSIAFVLMVLAGLGGLLMVLLSMEERHWKTGHHS